MTGFSHRGGNLFCEDLPVADLAARYGTPLYVYSRRAILHAFAEMKRAFRQARPLIFYSIKANSNIGILRTLARAGAGFDVVSGGELFRALHAGANPNRIVFSGVGKTDEEIAHALRARIFMLNVESAEELAAVNRIARHLGVRAHVALRVNPDVDARTHAKTTTGRKESKFGIDLPTAQRLLAERANYPAADICGIHMHLGSPIYTVMPFLRAMKRVSALVARARQDGAHLSVLNVGGGFAISYDGRPVIQPEDYARVILPAVKSLRLRLCIEPGRFIVGNAGILVGRVIRKKVGWHGRRFLIVDAGMNDLVRPALYGARHHIWPVCGPPSPAFGSGRRPAGSDGWERVDVVGPICESSDCFGCDMLLPPTREGDLLAIYSAGAYGMAMASTYNSRPRACEVLVSGRRARVIRRRETYKDLIRGEDVPDGTPPQGRRG